MRPDEHLPPEVELRIVQEALANIHKHAGVTPAVVRFDVDGDHRCVTVRDEGQGCDPAKIEQDGSQHCGLRGMREQAEAIGAKLAIETAPGRGTKVTVRLPVQGKS